MTEEARALVAAGWCQGALARDERGIEVAAWSTEARSWSVLGALLAVWHLHDEDSRSQDVSGHLIDARGLGEATEALGEVIGTASLEQWNDERERTHADVLDAFAAAARLFEERVQGGPGETFG